jgi:threonine/homoserine/homoserine lactone efflux protein
MLDSYVSYIPVCLISIGIAWAFRKLRPIVLQVFISFIIPTIVSFALAFMPELLKPSPPGEAWFAWTLILGATWAMVAVPVCIVAVTVFNMIGKTKEKTELKP